MILRIDKSRLLVLLFRFIDLSPQKIQKTSLNFSIVIHIVFRLRKIFDLTQMTLEVSLIIFIFLGKMLNNVKSFGLNLKGIVDF